MCWLLKLTENTMNDEKFDYRIERDSMGEIRVKKDCLWGSQTQRSLMYFKARPEQLMPIEVIRSLVLIKKAAAFSNMEEKKLSSEIGCAIIKAADKTINEKLEDAFPLSVWQTGSGTQSNMNVNEVIANLANVILHHKIAEKSPVHPNDHVNMGQSSNDTFPTAMNIAVYMTVIEKLLPALKNVEVSLECLVQKFSNVIKIGRTHLQDAVPMTVGQEFSAFLKMVQKTKKSIEYSVDAFLDLPQGGTAVGTGLNTTSKFTNIIVKHIGELTSCPFRVQENKYEGLSSLNDMVQFSGVLSTAATNFFKFANDIRLLSSGPRCGLNEIELPANEPGSSIMPGKVNPTQCEALTMICAQVMGYHMSVSIANSHGQLQLNVYRPMVVYNIIESIHLLSGGLHCFTEYCLNGIKVNLNTLDKNVNNSLMLATCLTPVLGYDKCADIVKKAYAESISLKESAIQLSYLSDEEYTKFVIPHKMIRYDDSH